MVAFRCNRFPQGVVPIGTASGIVDFRDGGAEVDDPVLAAALREVPSVFQIVEVDGEPVGQPSPRASKAEWVDYAVHQGLDRGEADAMTKADLIDSLKD